MEVGVDIVVPIEGVSVSLDVAVAWDFALSSIAAAIVLGTSSFYLMKDVPLIGLEIVPSMLDNVAAPFSRKLSGAKRSRFCSKCCVTETHRFHAVILLRVLSTIVR